MAGILDPRRLLSVRLSGKDFRKTISKAVPLPSSVMAIGVARIWMQTADRRSLLIRSGSIRRTNPTTMSEMLTRAWFGNVGTVADSLWTYSEIGWENYTQTCKRTAWQPKQQRWRLFNDWTRRFAQHVESKGVVEGADDAARGAKCTTQ